jgi:hypothetical protein
MPRNLYLAWQHPETRSWRTFARLERRQSEYELVFTRGALGLQTIPFDLFKMDLEQRYRFSELIPIFKNRLPSRGRSDFQKMATWLNLRGDEDEFTSLSRFGLIPGTDAILVYPEPDVSNGRYVLEFFVHGVRHMDGDVDVICASLPPGARLLPMLDVQNPIDSDAVVLRPERKSVLVGYVPAFYAHDIRTLVSKPPGSDRANVTVVRCNMDAPIQLRLLCRFESPAPADFRALQTEAHELLLSRAA